MSRPRILDLFCGAGGCSVGYHCAGFDVVGVDIRPQPKYSFEFVQADALDVLRCWAFPHEEIGQVDAIHASPPCQASSRTRSRWPDRQHPELIPSTRELLVATGIDAEEKREAMGMSWATGNECSQAVPPAFTKFIGSYLLAEVNRRVRVAA